MGRPGEYVIKFGKGRIRKEGPGISFFYWKKRNTVVSIPAGTMDVNFIFNETTRTFQAVSVQGQVTYRIEDVRKIFERLDFSIDPVTRSTAPRTREACRADHRSADAHPGGDPGPLPGGGPGEFLRHGA